MQKLLLVSILGLLTACAESDSNLTTSFYNSPHQKNIFVEDGVLALGRHKFPKWPFNVPACERCTVESSRVLLPQGPERAILVKNAGGELQVLVVDSKRSIKRYAGWSFKAVEVRSVQVCKMESCAVVTQGPMLEIEGYIVALMSFDVESNQSGIADSESIQFQVIIQRL